MRRLLVMVVLAAVTAGGAAPAAGARVLDETTIIPGRSIGKATLLANRATLDGRLGEGRLVKSVRTPFGRLVTYRYVARGVDVTFHAGTAVAILTKDERYGTKKGIGVGATRGDLKRTYAALACPTATLCTVGVLQPGARVTDFRLAKRSKKVVSVLVGVVLD